MTLPNELHPGFFTAAGGGFTIDQSLRFKVNQRLVGPDQMPTGNFTFSFWFKRGSLPGGDPGGLPFTFLSFANNQCYQLRQDVLTARRGSTHDQLSNGRTRDFSAWYHFVYVNNSGTTSLYLNGVLQTNTATTPSGSVVMTIGSNSNTSADNGLDGYMAEVNMLDGTVVGNTNNVIDEFGEYNTYGVWVPKKIDFTAAQYGDRGFRLTFDSSQTNAGIAEDSAPVGGTGHTARNDFTATGFNTSDLLFRSQDVYGDASTTYDSNNTNKIFLPDGVSYGPIKMFDGDLVNNACKSGTGSAQTWIYWRPSGGLSISSSLVVHCSNTADVRINGTSTGQTNDGQASNFPITIANPPSTLTELAIQGNSISSATIYGVVVDGTTLTENRDNDVDYFDTPTSNYPTINPLYPVTNPPQNGGQKDANLGYTGSANLWSNGASTMKLPSSGEYYWEHELVLHSDHQYFGVTRMPILTYGTDTGYISFRAYHDVNWYVYQDSSLLQTGTWKCCTGNIISQAYNIDTGVYRVWIDGSLVATNTWSNRPTDEDLFIFGSLESKTSNEFRVNYGQRPFLLATELGFGNTNKLLSNNLPEPTIKNGKKHFGILTYQGNGTSLTVTDTDAVQFTPDLVWIKKRGDNGGATATREHNLVDSVRGKSGGYYLNLEPSTDVLENSDDHVSAIGEGSITVHDITSGMVNQNLNTFVAWCWKAGGTPSVTYTVKVVSDSGNKYRFNDFGASAVTLDLEEGGTYVFDQSDSSNANHPLRFSTTSNGTHGGGSEYTTGVVTTGVPGQAGAKTTITVAASAPTLYYYCSVHSGMGGQANTNTTKGSSNFDGTLQSKVSANTDAGFSIVSYTGNNTLGATVGHGLSSAPEFILVKNREEAAGRKWNVYHEYADATAPQDKYLHLDTNDGVADSVDRWNDTAPTSTVFSLGDSGETNATDNFIAYCWHSVEGFSKFGGYNGGGTGSAPDYDGVYIHLGFRPSFLLIKRSNAGGDPWILLDSTRDTKNFAFQALQPDNANNEVSSGDQYAIDFLSNGFKCRSNNAAINNSTATYVYMAFAESPFGGENAPPATAR